MSLQGAVNAVPGRPYEYGGILPILAGIAGFLTKAVPVVSSIFGGIQQVRQVIAPPAPVAPSAMELPMEDDLDAWLASLSDDELIQLAVDEGLVDPAIVNAEMEERVRADVGAPPPFAPFTAPAIRTSAGFTTITQAAASGRFFGRELM